MLDLLLKQSYDLLILDHFLVLQFYGATCEFVIFVGKQ